MKKILLFTLLCVNTMVLSCTPTQQTSLQTVDGIVYPSGSAQNKAKVSHISLLTKQSHVSDGTGDMFNGQRRFAGSMGANAISYKGYQYVVFYEGKDRNASTETQYATVVIARRKLEAQDWEFSRLRNYKVRSEDAHNRSTIGISAEDGTIHIAFDHHNELQLNYARTANGVANSPNDIKWDDSVFTYTPNLGLKDENMGVVTYPSIHSVPGGNVVLYYRDGLSYGGDMRLAYYDSKTSEWLWVRELSSHYGSYLGKTDERGPYLADGIQVSSNKTLMMSWLWRETSLGCAYIRERGDEKMCNQGVYFAKSKDFGKTWLRGDGSVIANLAEKEAISIDNIGGPLIPVPHQARPSNVLNRSVIDPSTQVFHLFLSHLQYPYDDIEAREVYHYQIAPDGTWTGDATSFAARSVDLAFVGDTLYAFTSRNVGAIYTAQRNEDFKIWTKIDYELPSETLEMGNHRGIIGGYITWDLAQLHNGKASAIWHQATTNIDIGEPSALLVVDFDLF